LAWAQIVTDETSQTSVICAQQATELDPCPFPPFKTRTGFFATLVLALTFLANGGVGAFYTRYEVSGSVPAPKLDFVDGLLQGKAGAKILVEGVPLFGFFGGNKALVEIGTDLILEVSLPVYDPASGLLSNVNLANIELRDPIFDFKTGDPFIGATTTIIFNIVATTINTIADVVLVLANAFVAGFLQSNPLFLPALPNFPQPGRQIEFDITGTSISGVASGPGTSGYIDINAGASIRVTDMPDIQPTDPPTKAPSAPTDAPVAPTNAPVAPEPPTDQPEPDIMAPTTGRSDDEYAEETYIFGYELAVEGNSTDAIWYSSYTNPENDAVVIYAFRLMADGSVEVKYDQASDWEPAADPRE